MAATKPPGEANAGGLKGDASTAKRRGPSNEIALRSPARPDPEAGLERLGPWVLLGRDPLGKRALARCSGCAAVREISLVDGIPSCGCGRWRPSGAETFAATAAAAELIVARARHRGRR